jgi:uncharacterized protein (DUF2141 family)
VSRPARLIAVAAALLALGGAAQAASVTVVVDGATSGGAVRVSLCAGGLDPQSCPFGDVTSARGGTARFSFPEIRPGTYAAAAFQDVNGNGRLDRTPAGLPVEPYGFSNGVGWTAPPRFERAAFPVDGPTVVRVRIDLPPPGR